MPVHPQPLRMDEAHLVWVRLAGTTERVAHFRELLSPDEVRRADRFVFEDLRTRFTICRGVLREILGLRLGQAPQDVRFRYERLGKPHVVADGAIGPHFNVSHSGDRALIAVANSPLGVDLEMPQRQINTSAIASQLLSPTELREWEQMTEQDQVKAIMQLWVCKEALLKAMGLGIADGLRRVSFALPIGSATAFAPLHIDASLQFDLEDDGTCRTNSWIDSHAWQLRMLDAGDASFAALATTPAVQHVEQRAYSVAG